MKRISGAMIALVCLALAAGAGAEEKREKILQAVASCSPSIVKVEFECDRSDGKGAKTFHTTGFIVGAEGLVLVTDVESIDPPVGGSYQKPGEFTVHFDKETEAPASFLGKDEELNLALLRLKETDPDEEEEAGKAEAKAPAIRPLPLSPCETLGLAREILVVNRLSEEKDFLPTFHLLRITAVVPRPAAPPEYHLDGSLSAFSGCPVLTLDGKVVGMVALAPVEPGGGGRTITIRGRTFHIGSRRRRRSPRLLCTGDFEEFLADPSKFLRRKSWVGVRGLQALTEDLAEHFGTEAGGIILGEILKDSPAERAGLVEGDVVVSIDGEAMEIEQDRDVEKFRKRIQRAPGGTMFVLGVLREADGSFAEREIVLEVEEEPVQEYEVEEWEEETFGLRVKPLTRDFLDRQRLPLQTQGVRVTYVENAGFGNLAGLRRDDIIQSVVLVKTPDLEAFQEQMAAVIEARNEEVCFNVLRGGKSLFQCVRPDWKLADKKETEEE